MQKAHLLILAVACGPVCVVEALEDFGSKYVLAVCDVEAGLAVVSDGENEKTVLSAYPLIELSLICWHRRIVPSERFRTDPRQRLRCSLAALSLCIVEGQV